ncbi:MAG: hypothetical protein E3K36_11135 [Candidatus Brocadia sp.]|nr:hypothetical protein [Candidatus Brocadia sp.]
MIQSRVVFNVSKGISQATIRPMKKRLKPQIIYMLVFMLLPLKAVLAEVYIMTVRAYDNCKVCTGKTPRHKAYGITKSGKVASRGTVAVDPKMIALGTKLKIEGFGNRVFRAEDVGKAVKGRRMEIWMESHKKALRFGKKRLRVFVMK